MPETSTAGIFQVAFIARRMEQTPRAFFQTAFEPIGKVCTARHARGGMGLQANGERVRAYRPTYGLRALLHLTKELVMFSDIYLNQKNYFGIEKRLPFKAFWDNGGQCYLDLKVVDGKIIALCGQLINYTNTSIVNAAEEVYRSIIDYLISNEILVVRTKFSFKNIFSTNEKKYKEI